jgi:hypothetical protein
MREEPEKDWLTIWGGREACHQNSSVFLCAIISYQRIVYTVKILLGIFKCGVLITFKRVFELCCWKSSGA